MLFAFRWHRQLLLWPRPSHEAASYKDDSQSTVELWAVPKNGNLRTLRSISRKLPVFVDFPQAKLYCCLYGFQRPHKATAEEMTKFHSDEYIRFLRSIRPDNMSEYNKQMQRCELILLYFMWIRWTVNPGYNGSSVMKHFWQHQLSQGVSIGVACVYIR